MFKVYGVKGTRSDRVVWTLEELEVPYEFYQLSFEKGENHSPLIRQLNPGKKVPILVNGDFALTESAAICNYLGELHPEAGVVPKSGTEERALYDQWLFFVLSELEQPLWTMGKHRFALPSEWRVAEIEKTALWEFDRAASLLSEGLGTNDYMVRNHFTLVDLFISQTLGWAIHFGIELKSDTLTAYHERLTKRPSFARMKKVEKLELPCSN